MDSQWFNAKLSAELLLHLLVPPGCPRGARLGTGHRAAPSWTA